MKLNISDNEIEMANTNNNKCPFSSGNNRSTASAKKLKSSVVTLIMITCSYLTCYAPLSFYMLITGFMSFDTIMKLYSVFGFLTLLSLINSGINSLIFVLRSKIIRNYYIHSCKKCWYYGIPIINFHFELIDYKNENHLYQLLHHIMITLCSIHHAQVEIFIMGSFIYDISKHRER